MKLDNILLKLINDVLDLPKSGKSMGEPVDEAKQAILDLLDKSLVAPSDSAPRDDGKGYYYDGYHQGIADVRKVIKEDKMSNCCNAQVYDPSGLGIEGRCKDCLEMCLIVKEAE